MTHDPRDVPWALWLAGPVLALGIMVVVAALVTLIVFPFAILM